MPRRSTLRTSPSRSGGRSNGTGRNTPRSVTSRSAGTAHVSVWVRPLNLGAPTFGLGVRRRQVRPRLLELAGDQQVGLDVAGQVLDHSLGFGIGTLTEIRFAPVERGEADVLR